MVEVVEEVEPPPPPPDYQRLEYLYLWGTSLHLTFNKSIFNLAGRVDTDSFNTAAAR